MYMNKKGNQKPHSTSEWQQYIGAILEDVNEKLSIIVERVKDMNLTEERIGITNGRTDNAEKHAKPTPAIFEKVIRSCKNIDT